MDDYQLPAVTAAVSFFVVNMEWTVEDVSPEDDLHQWAVLRTSRKPDTRGFDFFVPFGG